MIAIINYGLGNLHSVQKATAYVGGDAAVTDDSQVILGAEKVILPGVGAFADGIKGLNSRNLIPVLRAFVASRKPLLGICLGMQLLFDESFEQGHHQGLGLLAGRVDLFNNSSLKVPQIGWNQVQVCKSSSIMQGIQDGDYFYFNHGYYCIPEEAKDILTQTDYGVRFASSVEKESILGVQFHPEKSQGLGLQILKNFVEM